MAIFWIVCGVSVALIIVSTLWSLPQERQDDHRRNWWFM